MGIQREDQPDHCGRATHGQSRLAPPYAPSGGYTALGLAYNPFIAEQRPGVEPALWLKRPDQPAAPHAAQGQLLQLIGPKGAGKTSLLLRWKEIQPGPYHYVAPGLARYCWPPFASIVYWDELDRLAAPVCWLSLRYAALRRITIVAGTHRDLGKLAERCGLQVCSYLFPAISASLLQSWANQRIAAASLPGSSPTLALDLSKAKEIAAQVGPSWREAAVRLHIWAAQQAQHSSRQ